MKIRVNVSTWYVGSEDEVENNGKYDFLDLGKNRRIKISLLILTDLFFLPSILPIQFMHT